MPNYPIQTIASAPEGSKLALEQLQQCGGERDGIRAGVRDCVCQKNDLNLLLSERLCQG